MEKIGVYDQTISEDRAFSTASASQIAELKIWTASLLI